MHELIAWVGFVGGWLLVAGPLLQAALELAEQNVAWEEIDQAREVAERTQRISPWWWLLPPVGYVLQRRRNRAQRDQMMGSLTPELRRGLVEFLDKATGWLFVAGGAACIATKETWELVEAYAWPTVVFWLLVVVAVALSGLHTALRMKRSHDALEPSV